MANCLYLVSSSSSREYVADCLEALALPRGMIMHFRYRTKYIDDTLTPLLPSEGATLPDELRDLPVVVVYLFQTQTGGIWKPGDTMGPGGPYLPLRCGRLLSAFKDGVIAHFFFELTGYVNPTDSRGSTRVLLNEKITFRNRTSYAHMSEDLDLDRAASEDTVAFQNIIDTAYVPGEWRTRSLGSAPLDVTYEIVSFRITGILHEHENQLAPLSPAPRYVGSNVLSSYQLKSGETYHLRLAIHLPYRSPASLPGQGQALLKLDFDSDIIKPIGPTMLRISSDYDLEYWSFIINTVNAQTSVLNVVCQYDSAVDRREFQRTELLCPDVSLPISILAAQSQSQTGQP